MVWSPQVRRSPRRGGGECFSVGHGLVDEFLEFASSRARPNTVRAYAHDLKTFFVVVGKDPLEVRPTDVMAFVTAQRRPRPGTEKVVRITDGGSGLSTATIRRRLAAVSAFYGYLITRGDVGVETNPVPRGLPTRASRRELRGKPLLRPVRRLPRILSPEEVAVLSGALRTDRDRAMVQAMVLGGLRRCEVLGLRLADLRLGEWRVFIAEGKGGVSHCTSLLLLVTICGRGRSRGESHALVGDGCVVTGRLVEPFGPVAASVGGQEPGTAPSVDGVGRHDEEGGGFGDGEHSLGSQALVSAGELVGAADALDHGATERFVVERRDAALVEDGGHFAVGVFV